MEIIITNKDTYLEIKSPEGHQITTYNEGDDIKEFNAFGIAYCPLDTDMSKYRLITNEEAERLNTERDNAYEAEQAKSPDDTIIQS